jgi:hypothetical protein
MATDNFCFYLQNRLIKTSKTGGQHYTTPFSIPCLALYFITAMGPGGPEVDGSGRRTFLRQLGLQVLVDAEQRDLLHHQGPMLLNFFRCNYITIGILSVIIIGKYAASGVNYA